MAPPITADLIQQLRERGSAVPPGNWVGLLQHLNDQGYSGYLQRVEATGTVHLVDGLIVGAAYGGDAGLPALVQCIVRGSGTWRFADQGQTQDDIQRDTSEILAGVRQVLVSYGLIVDDQPEAEPSLLDDGASPAELDDQGAAHLSGGRPAVVPTRIYRGFHPPRIGSTLGRCELLEEIGRGATSIVYRARHRGLAIDVAVKVLLPDEEQTDHHRITANEARLLARLNHPAILRVLDFDDEDRWPYLVVEYVNGPTLAEVLERRERLPAAEVVPVCYQIACGLAHAHEAEGIIHCDLKPGNVLLTRDGQAKIADLGLARITHRRTSAVTVFDPDTSRELRIAGTPWYISPEQVESGGATADHRSDMYALGAMAYHLLSGRPVYDHPDPMQVMVAHCAGQFTSLYEHLPDIDHDLADLVHTLLAREPRQRYDDYPELIDLLRTLSERSLGGRPRRSSLFKNLLARLWDGPG